MGSDQPDRGMTRLHLDHQPSFRRRKHCRKVVVASFLYNTPRESGCLPSQSPSGGGDASSFSSSYPLIVFFHEEIPADADLLLC